MKIVAIPLFTFFTIIFIWGLQFQFPIFNDKKSSPIPRLYCNCIKKNRDKFIGSFRGGKWEKDATQSVTERYLRESLHCTANR